MRKKKRERVVLQTLHPSLSRSKDFQTEGRKEGRGRSRHASSLLESGKKRGGKRWRRSTLIIPHQRGKKKGGGGGKALSNLFNKKRKEKEGSAFHQYL